MNRVFLSIVFALCASAALANCLSQRALHTLIPPISRWNYSGSGTLAPWDTFTRATTAYCFNDTGVAVSISSGVACFDHDLNGSALGLRLEQAATNIVLHNRDLTNASWTATNVTTAFNQTGIDGASNSASLITASAGNGTVLQTITLASSTREQSAYVKCVTCTGALQMTTDGSTYTSLTSSNCYTSPIQQTAYGAAINTNGWVRCQIPSQTAVTNPVVGFKIVNNSDSFIIDFFQNENPTGLYVGPTSPIATTTTSVARNADVVSGNVLQSGINKNTGTISIRFRAYSAQENASAILFEGSPNGSGNGTDIGFTSGGQSSVMTGYAGPTTAQFTGGTAPNSYPAQISVSYGLVTPAASVGLVSSVLGPLGLSQAKTSSPGAIAWGTSYYLGSRGGTSLFFNGYIMGLGIYNMQLPQQMMNSLNAEQRF